MPGYEIVWTRYGVHLAAMLLVFGPRQRSALVKSPHVGRQIYRSLLMLGMPIFFIWAVSRMPLNNALDMLWLSPIILIVLDRFVTREGRGWTIPLVTLVGFVGVLLIDRPSLPIGWSSILPMGTALCFALYIIITRQMRDEAVLPKMFHTALWVFLALTPFVPLFWRQPTLYDLVAMVAVGIFGWISLFLLDRSVDHVPPALMAPILYSTVLWSELLQWITQRSGPTHAEWVGSLLVFGAIVTSLIVSVTSKSILIQGKEQSPSYAGVVTSNRS